MNTPNGTYDYEFIGVSVCCVWKPVSALTPIPDVRVVIERNRRAGLFTCTDVSSRWDLSYWHKFILAVNKFTVY